MKNLALFIFLTLSFAIFSNLSAQVTPAGAGDTDLRDNNVRMRSNEIERIKRDGDKSSGSASQMNNEIDKKFPEINEDYEGIQRSQEAIVKAYTTGAKINYEQIEKSANDLTKNAERLNSNLFATKTKTKKEKGDKKNDEKSDKKDEEKPKEIKALIVELDNAIGSFVSSAMFQNLKAVEQKVADKAQLDLAQIRKISGELSKEAGKLK